MGIEEKTLHWYKGWWMQLLEVQNIFPTSLKGLVIFSCLINDLPTRDQQWGYMMISHYSVLFGSSQIMMLASQKTWNDNWQIYLHLTNAKHWPSETKESLSILMLSNLCHKHSRSPNWTKKLNWLTPLIWWLQVYWPSDFPKLFHYWGGYGTIVIEYQWMVIDLYPEAWSEDLQI